VSGPLAATPDVLHRNSTRSGARKSLTIPVTATGVGRAGVDLKLTARLTAPQTLALDVSPGTSELYRRSCARWARGEPHLSAILWPFRARNRRRSLAVSSLAGIDVPALLQALDRYPYGCSEQIVSRALPLLYVNRLAKSERLESIPIRSAYTRRDRTRAGSRTRTRLRRLVGERCRQHVAACLRHRFFDPPRGKTNSTCRKRNSMPLGAPAQSHRQCERYWRGTGPQSPMRLCPRPPAWRRSWVICAISPMPSSTLSRARSPCASRRRARFAWRPSARRGGF